MEYNQLESQLALLPRSCGVYKFKDSNNTVLYVGKAHNLKSRVSSYFTDTHLDRPRIVQMIPLVYEIETITTDNDIEALVLESALIKQIQPKYNTLAKDDKSYAYLYINHKDEYPTVKIVRQVSKEQVRNGKIFGPYPNGTAIKRVFKYLRKIYPFCISKDPTKPCFDMHIGLCPGPIPSAEYKENIEGIIKFLSGRNKQLITELEQKMSEYSKNLEYENAALMRDKIDDLRYLTSKINVDNDSSELEYRQLKKEFALKNIAKLSKEIGIENATRIECYDISNTQGKNAYGSMTVAINGEIDTSSYRIFKIKQLDTPNDPAMLVEVLQRRLKHINNDPLDSSLNSIPNIILIDGGKSQLSVISENIKFEGTILGITKGRKYKKRGGKLLDEFLILNDKEATQIKIRTSKILSQLRDEAHRFAILHHRKNRVATQTKSYIDEIPNVGPKTKKLIKQNFNSKEELINSSTQKLLEVINNRKIVESIQNHFKK